MYTNNNLTDINSERAKIINDAMSQLRRRVVRGVAYTPRELSAMTENLISARIFESCLRRGYRVLEKRKEKNIPENHNKYFLFGDWRATCSIRKEGVKVITIKEYDECGELISEYQKRRGRPEYVAIF